jgi:hypothetical protein
MKLEVQSLTSHPRAGGDPGKQNKNLELNNNQLRARQGRHNFVI